MYFALILCVPYLSICYICIFFKNAVTYFAGVTKPQLFHNSLAFID